jgi:hypothetical protein
MSCGAEMGDSSSPLSDIEISIDPEIVIVSYYAKPAKKLTDKAPLDERRYTPLSSVQSLHCHGASLERINRGVIKPGQ